MKKFWVIFVFLSIQVFAQQEMSQWYFGNSSALDFNPGCPMPIGGSEINTIESSSSISTSSGLLQFYTDGLTIYNRNNEVMSNGDGLLGELSSTNGALIVPLPNNLQRYYVFTADAIQNYQENGTGLGINYSVVNMSASGGLGAVETKNVNLLPQGSEKLSAVRHANGEDFWVVTHFQNTFYAYPITSSGVGSPVTTSIGINIDNFNNIRGAIKFSPDGTKVAVCHSFFEPSLSGRLVLFIFNPTTGILSNPQTLGADDLLYYGVEFSPNSEVLYTSGKLPVNNGLDTGDTQIFQFDLTAPSIVDSRYEVTRYLSSPFVNLAGLMQVALDGKMYHSFGGPLLSVIRKPNRLGASCDYQFKSVNLGISSSSIGLPIGVQTFYDNPIEYDDLCFNDVSSFTLNTSRNISSVLWDFGDPTSSDNSSTDLNPSHLFSALGTYTVTAVISYGDDSTSSYQVNIKIEFPPILTPAELTQCDVDGVNDGSTTFNLLDALDAIIIQNDEDILFIDLGFYTSQSDAFVEVNGIMNPGNYINTTNGQVIYVNLYLSLDCFRTTTITLNVDPAPELANLDVTVCASVIGEESWVVLISSVIAGVTETYPNEEIRIYSSVQDAGLQTGEETGSEVFGFSDPTILFYRLGSPDECIGVGKVTLTIQTPLELENQELVFCYTEEDVVLEGPPNYVDYEWNTGETTQSIAIEQAGTYSLTVGLFAGCEGTIIYVVTEGPFLQAEISVNDFQQNNEIIINASLSEGDIFYSIDGGSIFERTGIFTDLAPGSYNVVVIDEAGCNRITETVLVRGAPRFFTPNSDGYNDRWHVINAQDYVGMEVEIFDRFGKQMTTLTNSSEGWDGTYNGKQLATNTYWYSLTYEGKINYGYFTLIIRGL